MEPSEAAPMGRRGGRLCTTGCQRKLGVATWPVDLSGGPRIIGHTTDLDTDFAAEFCARLISARYHQLRSIEISNDAVNDDVPGCLVRRTVPRQV